MQQLVREFKDAKPRPPQPTPDTRCHECSGTLDQVGGLRLVLGRWICDGCALGLSELLLQVRAAVMQMNGEPEIARLMREHPTPWMVEQTGEGMPIAILAHGCSLVRLFSWTDRHLARLFVGLANALALVEMDQVCKACGASAGPGCRWCGCGARLR